MKILLVEDDEMAVYTLQRELNAHHYSVDISEDGQLGLELAQTFYYDLLILDIILPNLDGISICRQLRSHGSQIPILLLSAKESSRDRVMGLEAGADDYLIKPYETSELIARIQALLRRGGSIFPTVLTWEKLQLHSDACQVTYSGNLLRLTPKEYSILELFLRNPWRIYSRSAILDLVWPCGEFPSEEAVSTQIKGLRRKLKEAGMTANLIDTVYGLGYRLKAPPDNPSPSSTSQDRLESPKTGALRLTSMDRRSAQAKVEAVLQQEWNSLKESLSLRMMVFDQLSEELSTGSIDERLKISARAEAHRLIGSLGSFGLPEGSQVARQIEQLLRLEFFGKNEAQQLEDLLGQLKELVNNKRLETAGAIANSKLGSGRLLIIDDDAVLTKQIKKEGLNWGFEIEVATNLKLARKLISSHPPDVIVLDITFPGIKDDGLNLLAELAQESPSIPVLIVTARNQLSARVQVARSGGKVFLQKPISSEEIIKAVIQEVNRNQKPEAKILIVDDDLTVLAILSNLLTPWGFEVKTSADPQQFWQDLTTTGPDLLILDIEMPSFSGIELCQVVRGDPRWSDLPVLFLSAHRDADTVHRVFAAGADDYVQKPIIGPELIARILNRLERSRMMHRFAEIDELTGVATRHKSIGDLERSLHLAERENKPFCLIVLDLDHFKQVNDRYGHEVGDYVLSLFGKRLKQFFRSEDIAARWGGEEFVLGLYGLTQDKGMERLSDFQKIWRREEFTDANNKRFGVTFSAGIAEYPNHGVTLPQLYRVADSALYRAKAMGRNRILVSTAGD